MPKFYAKSPVMHNGDTFVPGTAITLTADESKPLLAVGAVMTEEDAKRASIQKEAVDAQAATISEKDAEIASLRAQLDAAKAGTAPAAQAK